MFFYLAKVLWFLAQPSTLIALLIAYGAILIWTAWARWGRRFVTIGAVLLLVCGLSPLGNALILPLEDRFPRANLEAPPAPAGVILLGGAEIPLIAKSRSATSVNEAAERLIETATLASRFADAKIAISGGDAGILYKSGPEAASTAALLAEMGVDKSRFITEEESRDTYENAAKLKAKLETLGLIGPNKKWVLVTSAHHMPRAIGAFRQAGFAVEAWPVDYRTRGSDDLWRPFDKVSEGLRRVDVAAREWVGLLVYWLAGRSEALFPAPNSSAGCDLATSRSGTPPASPCRPKS